MRGTIVIDENRCKGCTLCTLACPKDVIEMAERFTPRGYHPAQLVDPQELCTGCLLCATVCPDVAITVYREIRRQPTARKVEAATLATPV
jgi:2-oxoglutarate ferredoxin oxidoreductase subunit delta